MWVNTQNQKRLIEYLHGVFLQAFSIELTFIQEALVLLTGRLE